MKKKSLRCAVLWEILCGEEVGLNISTSLGKFPVPDPIQRGRLSMFSLKPASEMWGHLSAVIRLVDVRELECKPGKILGLLF